MSCQSVAIVAVVVIVALGGIGCALGGSRVSGRPADLCRDYAYKATTWA